MTPLVDYEHSKSRSEAPHGVGRCMFTTVICLAILVMTSVGAVVGYPSAQAGRPAQPGGAAQGNIQNGRRIYAMQNCAQCHGSEGQSGTAQIAGPRIGPPRLSAALFIEAVREPTKPMPAYSSKTVSDADLADVYAYLKSIPPPAQTEMTSAGNAENGKNIYRVVGCYECHDTVGQGGAGTGPRLAPDPIQFSAFVHQMRYPVEQMPPYTAKVLSDSELADIYAFLRSVPKPPNAQSIPLLQ
jgi:mono/diheme cytochrome c family protein